MGFTKKFKSSVSRALLLTLVLVGAWVNPSHAADTKISNLPQLSQSSWASGDIIPIVDISAGPASKRTTVAEFDARYLTTALLDGYIFVGNGSDLAAGVAVSGDITLTNAGVVTIANDAVSNAKLADMAASTIKGNNTGGAASPLDLTVAQVKTMLGLTGTNSGDVTLGAVGAVPNANGASLAAQVLTLQPANGSFPGVLTTGTQDIAGVKNFLDPPDMQGNVISSVADPVASDDAATKNYVDNSVNGISWKASVIYATAAALPANTYNNGVAGVGATLTGDAVGALSIDGQAVAPGDRVLIKDEATPSDNGIYDVTVEGDGGTAYILTRAVDFDQTAEVETAAVLVTAGDTLSGTAWVQTTSSATIGTSDLVFTQFAAPGSWVAGTGLDLTGNTFSLEVPVIIAHGGTNSVAALSNDNVMISSGGAIVELGATGAAGEVLTSQGAGLPPVWDALPANALTDTHIFVGDGTNTAQDVALSGDATIANTGVLTIANSAVSNAKMANMNNNTVKGNKSGGAAAPSDLAISDVVESTSSVLTITNGTKAIIGAADLSIEVAQADSVTDGYLSATDWVDFNAKLSPDSAAFKRTVVAASTANLVLSGEQNIDGVITSAMRVLVKDQTDPTENGIYVTDSGAWARASDFNAASEITGASVAVQQGNTHEGKIFVQNKIVTAVGVDAIDFIDGYVVLGAFNEQAANGVGASLTHNLALMQNRLTFHSADATNPGMVDTTTQTFAGAKTFSTSVQSPVARFGAANFADNGVLNLPNNTRFSFRNAANDGNASFYLDGADEFQLEKTLVIAGSLSVTGSTSGTFRLSAADTTTNYVVKMPDAQGAAGETIVNDGSGNLSWSAIGAAASSVYDTILGDAADVTAGIATHSSFAAAYAATPAGGVMRVLPRTFTENLTVGKNISIEGSGYGAVLDGNLTFDASSDYSYVHGIKINGDVDLQAGSAGVNLSNVWTDDASAFVDNGSGNYVQANQF